MMFNKLRFSLLVGFILTAVLGLSVEAAPPLPASFYGTVLLNGVAAPQGTIVSAWINDRKVAETTTTIEGTSAVYMIDVLGDDPDTAEVEGGVAGDTISFQIAGFWAEQTAAWSSGDLGRLDLTPSTRPTAALTTGKRINASLLQYGAAIVDFSSEASSSASHAVENAIDAKPGSAWFTGTPNNQWFKVELAGGRSRLIDRVVLKGTSASGGLKDFEVKVSTTGTEDADFSTVLSGTVLQDNNRHTFTFAPTPARYVQLYVHNNWGHTGSTLVYDFQALTPERQGGIVSLLDGTPPASIAGFSSQFSSYAAQNAIDFNANSSWQTPLNRNTNQWLKVLLSDGHPHLVDRVMLRGHNGLSSPKDFQIRVSGTTSEDAAFATVFNGTLPSNGQSYWFTFPPVPAKYVQLFIANGHGSKFLKLYDFQVYSPQLGGATVPFEDLSVGPLNPIDNWEWDFGDGNTSNEQVPLHTYAAPGIYNVSLTVTDTAGLSDTASMAYTVFESPVANFTSSPLTPDEGQPTAFSDNSSDSDSVILGWQWQTSAGDSATNQNPDFSFPDNGDYEVSLTVTDSQLLTDTATKTVSVFNAPPAVEAGGDQALYWGQTWMINPSVSDPGTADRATLTCDWDFGDDQTAQVLNCSDANVFVPHDYAAAGTYTATLTVTDKDGAPASDSLSVEVRKRHTQLVNYGARSISDSEAEIKAGLFDVDDWDQIIDGRIITFDWDGQTLTGTTDASGVATIVASLTPGQEIALTAAFAGDDDYDASSDTDTLRAAPVLPLGDIIFMIDETRSMGDDQAEVRARIDNIAQQIGYAVDYRFGLVGFGSDINAGEPRVMTPLTADPAAFSDALDALLADGTYEVGFQATLTAMSEELDFRQSAGVCAILITDDVATINTQAPATQDDALAALNARDAVFLGITTLDDDPLYGYLPLADGTGGSAFDIIDFRDNPGPVLVAIIDDCAQAIIAGAPPDLQLAKSDGLDTAQTGETITYEMTINNYSVQDATGIVLTDTLPANTTFVQAGDGGGEDGGLVTWPTFDLVAGAGATRTVTVQVDAALPDGVTEIINTAEVSDDGANGPDPTPEDNTASDATAIIVVEGPPVLAPLDDPVLDENTTLDVALSAGDPDGDAITLSASGLPAFAALDDAGDGTGALALAPGYDDAGSYPGVEISATDGAFTDTLSITITVNNVNRAPVANDQALATDSDTPLGITLTASDDDGDGALTFTVLSDPAQGALSGQAPNLTYTPNAGYTSTEDSFTFQANDGGDDSNIATISITINPVANDPPQLTIDLDSVQAAVGQTAENSGTVSDSDGDVVTLDVSIGAIVNNNDGTWSWSFTPDETTAENQTVTVTADDGNGGSASDTFELTVTAVSPLNGLLNLDEMTSAYDPTTGPNAPAGKSIITAIFSNISTVNLKELFFEVAVLTRRNILLNADGGPGGVGSTLTVPPEFLGEDGVLVPGETFTVEFEIGLQRRRSFSLHVDAYGVADDPAATSAPQTRSLENAQKAGNSSVVDYSGVGTDDSFDASISRQQLRLDQRHAYMDIFNK